MDAGARSAGTSTRRCPWTGRAGSRQPAARRRRVMASAAPATSRSNSRSFSTAADIALRRCLSLWVGSPRGDVDGSEQYSRGHKAPSVASAVVVADIGVGGGFDHERSEQVRACHQAAWPVDGDLHDFSRCQCLGCHHASARSDFPSLPDAPRPVPRSVARTTGCRPGRAAQAGNSLLREGTRDGAPDITSREQQRRVSTYQGRGPRRGRRSRRRRAWGRRETS